MTTRPNLPHRLSLPQPMIGRTRRRGALRACGLALAVALAAGCSGAAREVGPGEAPAAQAAAVAIGSLDVARTLLDLSEHPLAEGADLPRHRTASALRYRAAGSVEPVFAAQRELLLAAGWREADGSFVNAQSGSALFNREGFWLSLGVVPAGAAGGVTITLRHHGNAGLEALPRPDGLTAMYVAGHTAVFRTDRAVDDAADAFADVLAANGWEPYGVAGPTRFFRQGALRLGVTATDTSAGRAGATSVTVSAELLSAEIPAPAGATVLAFDEPEQALRAMVPGSFADFIAGYGETLAPHGWSQSLAAPVRIEGRQVMTFRNARQDMLRLSFDPAARGATNLVIGYESKAQLDAMNQRLDEQAQAYRDSLKG
jgi:hypothetical protein